MKYICGFIILSVLLVPVFLSAAKNDNKKVENDGLLVQLSVYPTGMIQETYTYKIYQSGKLYCLIGDRSNNSSDEIVTIKKEKVTYLNSKELHKIKELIVEFDKQGNIIKKRTLKGGWEIVIKTKSNIANINLSEIKNYNISLLKLFEIIKKNTPLELKIHSWS